MSKRVRNIAIYIAVFLVVFLLAFVLFNMQESNRLGNRVSELANSKYPVMEVGNDISDYNCMSAYISDVDLSVVRSQYTVIDNDKTLTLKLHNYDYDITAIQYSLFESDPDSPQEEGTLNQLKDNKKENVRTGQITFQSDISPKKSYYLKLSVRLDSSKKACFYTRIINGAGYHLDEYFTFADAFHKATLDKTEFASDYASYLETSADAPLNSLQEVTINSPSDLVSYGSLTVKEEASPRVQVSEINGTYAVVKLNSIFSTQVKDDVVQYYDIEETFKMRYTATRMYLLDYTRSMNAYYNESIIDSSNSYISLGIHSSDTVSFESSDSGKKVCFVSEGQLWYYDYSNSNAMQVYSFFSDSVADLRNNTGDHGIKILSFDDEGNVRYLVYGYINRGSHEGENGIEIMEYDAASNCNEELAFLRTSSSYEAMNKDISYFTYLSKKNIFYCLVSGDFHRVDLGEKKDEIIKSGIANETLTASKDQSIIAMEEQDDISQCRTIEMTDLESGEKQTFTAPDNERIHAIGFLANDFIYGNAKTADISTKSTGKIYFPMYELHIVNMDGEEIKTYSKDGLYIIQTKITGNVLEMSFAGKSGGKFRNSSQTDYIRYKDSEEDTVSLTTVYSDSYLTQLYFSFPSDVYVQVEPDMVPSKIIASDEDRSIELVNSGKEADQYYVYASGSQQGVFTDLPEAIQEAQTVRGIVIDGEENVLWQCVFDEYDQVAGMDNVVKVSSSKQSLAGCLSMIASVNGRSIQPGEISTSGESIESLIEEYSGSKALNLNGCTTDEILYYISQGSPVLAKYTGGKYVIVMSYNQTKIRYLDPVSGTSVADSRDNVTTALKKAGNLFYSYLPEQ